MWYIKVQYEMGFTRLITYESESRYDAELEWFDSLPSVLVLSYGRA